MYLSRLITTAVVLAIVTSVSADSAIAACYGSSCHGLDPNTEGCAAGAYTVSQSNNYLWQLGNVHLYVQLRYSPQCAANWSRSYTQEGQGRYIKADLQGYQGFTIVQGPGPGSYLSAYTNMVNGQSWQCATGAMKSWVSPWYNGNPACG